MPQTWMPTFDEAIGRANRYCFARLYAQAAEAYELAATLAPRHSFAEQAALEEAWRSIALAFGWTEPRFWV